jgi:hypothetical protein
MIIDHTNCLHERVTNCWPYEREPPLLEIFANGFGLRSAGGYISQLCPRVLNRFSPNKLPDVTIKAANLFLHLQESLRVNDYCRDFALVSNNLRINQQSRHVIFGVLGDFLDVKLSKAFL